MTELGLQKVRFVAHLIKTRHSTIDKPGSQVNPPCSRTATNINLVGQEDTVQAQKCTDSKETTSYS